MGNEQSTPINEVLRRRHRMLQFAVKHSLLVDPRNLEFLDYGPWASTAASLVSSVSEVWVHPQLPIWVSPRDEEEEQQDDDPDRTLGDSRAVGVAVDVALLTADVEPLPTALLEERTIFEILMGFIISRGNLHEVAPRCLNVRSLHAPLLIEIKRSPSRNPESIEAFQVDVTYKLKAACLQAKEQAQCLFSSLRFMFQDDVYLIGATGEYWCVCFHTRQLAEEVVKEESDGGKWSCSTLLSTKKHSKREDPDDEPPETEVDDYSTPNTIATTRELHDAQRRARFADRNDRLDTRRDEESTFLEMDNPEEYFRKTKGKKFTWSDPLRLGTEMSDKYLDYLKRKVEGLAIKKRAYHETTRFPWPTNA